MATLNAIVAVLTVAGMMAITWGYRASLRHRGTATWYFAMGVAVLAGDTEIRGAIIIDAKDGHVITASAEDIQYIYEFNRGALFVQSQNSDKTWTLSTAGELLPNPTRLHQPEEFEE